MVEKKGEGGPLRAVNVVVGVNSGVGARHRAVRGTGSAERCFSKLRALIQLQVDVVYRWLAASLGNQIQISSSRAEDVHQYVRSLATK